MENAQPILSNIERVILSNQYRTLAKLHPEEAAHYDNLRDIVDGGYRGFYSELFENILDEQPREEADYIIDVLDTFRSLKYAYADLADKDGIDPCDVEFDGWEGNEDYACLRFTEYLKGIHRFRDILTDDLCLDSCHKFTRARYTEMLRRFKQVQACHEKALRISREELAYVVQWERSDCGQGISKV